LSFARRPRRVSSPALGFRLTLRSPDGEEGYPGNLDVTVTYSVPADRNELRIDYEATTDRATPFNPTNHAYWNLRGEAGGDVLGHVLQIEASAYTPINAALIPRGHHAPVGSSPDVAPADPCRGIAGTPFDFRTPHALGARLAADHEQLHLAGGYDHNYVLGAGTAQSRAESPESRVITSGAAIDSASGSRLSTLDSRLHGPAATVLEPESGRVMEVLTTEPGLQLYSGNFLDGSWPGKGGRIHGKHAGFCLETQHFPDSPNQPAFPSTILRPGQVFRSTTIYRFATVA
jgi:aldose 1-epimerase